MRKKILSIILTTTMVLGLIPGIPCVNQVKAESSWKLVWSDEFNGDSLNTDVWTRETGGSGWETMNFSIIQTVQIIHMYQMEH